MPLDTGLGGGDGLLSLKVGGAANHLFAHYVGTCSKLFFVLTMVLGGGGESDNLVYIISGGHGSLCFKVLSRIKQFPFICTSGI